MFIVTRIQGTWYDGVCHPPPWGGVPSSITPTTKRAPIPNDASSESSRRDVFNYDLFGIDTIPTAVEISSMENRLRGVVIVCYAVHSMRVCFIIAHRPVPYNLSLIHI